MAARVLGESARAVGLDPATLGPPLARELALADEYPDEYRGVPVPLVTAAHPNERPDSVPFDVERWDERPAAVPALAGDEPLSSRGTSPPFDLERETSGVRAA